MTIATALDQVVAALEAADFTVSGRTEADVQAAASRALSRAMIPHRREVVLGTASRIDLLTTKGVGIEVKIGAWSPDHVVDQLVRYAGFGQVRALVLLSERGTIYTPTVQGKPVRHVGVLTHRSVAV